ncbi:basic helix-loop-helix domain-containing protein [Salinadaptatus halalkaliphilus]|uniref:hypothetical protein n=1 Tax=Salinadaptatus halalkaliphilus TaxID=2419781 RepID=UPI0015804C38|nr:hypothetical protein [Salinadaptatus halalkaliphilus]
MVEPTLEDRSKGVVPVNADRTRGRIQGEIGTHSRAGLALSRAVPSVPHRG